MRCSALRAAAICFGVILIAGVIVMRQGAHQEQGGGADVVVGQQRELPADGGNSGGVNDATHAEPTTHLSVEGPTDPGSEVLPETLSELDVDASEYTSGKRLVTARDVDERPKEFAVSLVSCSSEPALFEPFSVSPTELKDYAFRVLITAVQQEKRAGADSKGNLLEMDVGPSKVEHFTVGEKVTRGEFPLIEYDLVLRDAQYFLIDRKLLSGFFERALGVEGPVGLHVAGREWTPRGLTVTVAQEDGRIWKTITLPVAKEVYVAERPAIEHEIQAMLNSEYLTLGLSRFALNPHAYVSTKDYDTYFNEVDLRDWGGVKDTLLTYLRANALLSKRMPPAVAIDPHTLDMEQMYGTATGGRN